MFKGRTLLIATKHEKEKVIAPILEKELGVKCIVALNFDTDELGTFTGEVERKDDPITTARKKCLRAMELANCDLAVSSEGSFGAHPTIFFVPANDEILFFIDKKNDIEIIVRELSTETNFNASEISSEQELIDFANKAKFPSHSIILSNAKNSFVEVQKGIHDWTSLKNFFYFLIEKNGVAYAQTDMRALHNPTRMINIEKAAIKLAQKIKSNCPKCNTPGFGITDSKQGLPCDLCNYPTRSTLSYIYCCSKCAFSKEEKYPNGKKTEQPMYCDVCNP